MRSSGATHIPPDPTPRLIAMLMGKVQCKRSHGLTSTRSLRYGGSCHCQQALQDGAQADYSRLPASGRACPGCTCQDAHVACQSICMPQRVVCSGAIRRLYRPSVKSTRGKIASRCTAPMLGPIPHLCEVENPLPDVSGMIEEARTEKQSRGLYRTSAWKRGEDGPAGTSQEHLQA